MPTIPNSQADIPFAAVICAAGGGTRMGKNKALCRVSHDETFLDSIVSSVRNTDPGALIVAVIGAQADEVRAVHDHLDIVWVENEDWAETHMLDSLLLGLRHVPRGISVLHWPVDCIGVDPADLRRLLDAPEAPFTSLSFNHHAGHPLRIDARKVEWILDHASEFSSLRDVMRSDTRTFIDAGVDVLMNCNDREKLAEFMTRRDRM